MKESTEIPQDSISSAIEFVEQQEPELVAGIDETTLPQTIRELRDTVFLKNPLKNSKISHDNRKGMTALLIYNNFMEEHYGVRIKAYDDLISDTMQRNMSIDATGLLIFSEILGKINASFQNSPSVNESPLKRLF